MPTKYFNLTIFQSLFPKFKQIIKESLIKSDS